MPKGWTGKILRINLTKRKTTIWEYDGELARKFIGGRGIAIKLLWDLLTPGTDPLSPGNKLIFAAGPLNALAPNAGKLVVAAKSPLTSGYGDGNLGTRMVIHLRKAGYDAIILEGALDKPGYIFIDNNKTEIIDARDLWGLDAFETERKLREIYGENVGIVEIGPGGENQVLYATILSQEGRSGGRPGMGAVMGSKKVKAIVVKGTKEIDVYDKDKLARLSKTIYEEIKKKPGYNFWRRQGTMMTVRWCQENSTLPSYNFKEGVFEFASEMDGYAMEKIKIKQRGCPLCNMICGNVVEDYEGEESELDYENVAMLGSNIGIGDLKKIAVLNKLADKYGLDTISLGSTIAFSMEAKERGILPEAPEWGDFNAVKELIEDIAYKRTSLGKLLSQGTMRASQKLGGESYKFAMNIKGLEISAYDCRAAPAMALAFGTSPIGAHHKDAWVISWEIKTDRTAYNKAKVEKVLEFQRIRGGMFESLTICRLPWIELGIDLEYYAKLFKAATGISVTLDDLFFAADRIYDLIRLFWIREYTVEGKRWSRLMDYPPVKWFEEPLTKGAYKGATLDKEKYGQLLNWYYEYRGWDYNGVPKRETLEKHGLSLEAKQIEELGVKLE